MPGVTPRTGGRGAGEGGQNPTGAVEAAAARDRWSRLPGEPCAVKVACTVCAVRRVVISLPQAGGMRKEIPGLPIYLDVKIEGDKADWGSGAYSKAL
jgi:hypothetical protein